MTLESIFIRWAWARAVLHNGWWLATSLYLVTNGHLSASQLVMIGVIQGIASVICEIPAGIVADVISRKWSLVISHLLMGVAMLTTGLVTDFSLLAATQVLWGISWTFASGADVAYITDELNQPSRIAVVLTKMNRAQLLGAAVGLLSVGLLAWATSLSIAIVCAGSVMLLLGIYVTLAFREERFVPVRTQHWAASLEVFKEGFILVRRSRTILLVFAATFLVNGASDAYVRLFPKQLINIGLPVKTQPIVWLTAISIVALLVGVIVLRIVEKRVQGADAARRDYALACVVGFVGLLLLALAPNVGLAALAIITLSGVTLPLTRTLATIMVNRRTHDKVRATVHSFLAQAEYIGEIVCGAAVGLLAHIANLPVALSVCAALLAITFILMLRIRTDTVSNVPPQ